jgi:hypothetical protein
VGLFRACMASAFAFGLQHQKRLRGQCRAVRVVTHVCRQWPLRPFRDALVLAALSRCAWVYGERVPLAKELMRTAPFSPQSGSPQLTSIGPISPHLLGRLSDHLSGLNSGLYPLRSLDSRRARYWRCHWGCTAAGLGLVGAPFSTADAF